MEWIISNGSDLVSLGLKIVGAFAIVASMTPNTTDNKIADLLLSIINRLGFNVGKATNATNNVE